MAGRHFEIIYDDDIVPVCPHCDQDLTEVLARKRGVPLVQGRTIAFICPHCRKLLGFGQERVA